MTLWAHTSVNKLKEGNDRREFDMKREFNEFGFPNSLELNS
jgi:hypothetical protein